MSVEATPRASEGGHWYAQDGTPVYEVPRAAPKDGQTHRQATLRDARKLQLAPGITSITGVLAKPGLETWLQNEAIMASLTAPDEWRQLPDEQIMPLIRQSMNERSRLARERGTVIHAAVETSLGPQGSLEQLGALRAWAEAAHSELGVLGLATSEIVVERPVTSTYGYGTKTDAYHEGAKVLIDWKTCDKLNPEKPPTPYDGYRMQVAASIMAVAGSLEGWSGYIGYIDREQPLCKIVPVEDLKRNWEGFHLCLNTWFWQNNYKPTWAQ
jgi:hypothetical protein